MHTTQSRPVSHTLLLLLICLALQACDPVGKAQYQTFTDKQPGSTQEATKPGRKVFLTFLGFHGHESCFTDIRQALQKEDKEIVCTEASPQSPEEFSICCNCCGKLDGHIWEKGLSCCGINIDPEFHLGLGSVTQQARTAEKRLRQQGLIQQNDEIILLAQSQGVLVLMEFWRLYHKQYNIKGAVALAGPFGGAQIITSLSSRQKLQEAAQLAEADNKSTCCCLPTTTCLACCLPYCAAPAFHCCGYCCCKGLTDMTPGSALIRSLQTTLKEMAAAKLPFLNFTAQSPAPVDFQDLPYGPRGTKYLVGGGADVKTNQPKPSDNLIATHSQSLPIQWPQAKPQPLEADHGLFDVENSETGSYYPRIFCHPTALKETVDFCKHHFSSNVEASAKRK